MCTIHVHWILNMQTRNARNNTKCNREYRINALSPNGQWFIIDALDAAVLRVERGLQVNRSWYRVAHLFQSVRSGLEEFIVDDFSFSMSNVTVT